MRRTLPLLAAALLGGSVMVAGSAAAAGVPSQPGDRGGAYQVATPTPTATARPGGPPEDRPGAGEQAGERRAAAGTADNCWRRGQREHRICKPRWPAAESARTDTPAAGLAARGGGGRRGGGPARTAT